MPQPKKPAPQTNPYEQALERKQKMPSHKAPNSKAPSPAIPDSKVERAVVNFTRLPEKLLESLLTNAANFTPLNSEHLKKDDDPAEQLAQEQEELVAVRRRLQQLRGEEEDARAYFKEKDQIKQREEEEEAQQKAQEEEQQQQAEMAGEDPGSKQARGSLFGKKKKKPLPQKTIENKAGQSKH